MTKLVALKRLRYPSGMEGVEYQPGEEFEALSDRDVKALTLVRFARRVEVPPPPPKAQPRKRGAQAEKAPEPAAAAPTPTPEPAPAPATGATVAAAALEGESGRNKYLRTDMQPED